MIKTVILAATFIITLVPETQAHPRAIWSFLGGVAVGTAVTNNYYQPYYTDPYYYAPPPVVYYGRPVAQHYYQPPVIVMHDRWGNRCGYPRRW